MLIEMDIELSGPLFNGEADAALLDYRDALEYDLAARGRTLVVQRLAHVLQHPTGNYTAHIRDRSTARGHEVFDSRVIYGPWLEGTGSRNATTRFKGYHTFRQSGQQLDREARRLAEDILPPYLHRMGGSSWR